MSEIFIILFLILLNGIFAMSEMAVVSARKSNLQADASKGSKSARTALNLASDPDKFLSAVQIGITLIGIVDTNCDPEELDYVIPGNDDAIRAVKLIVSKMADAVIEAKQGEVLEGAMEIEVPAEGFGAAEAEEEA